MKNIFKYMGLLALGFVSLTSCQDDVDAPAPAEPVATLTANTTIAEVKAAFWSDDRNYIKTIETKENGDHYIIKGRVISSDASGNIYKSLIIQDETAALAMSINANSLYTAYRVGQEIVLDLTDMYIGKYNGLQQLGFPNFTEQYGWEATFMPKMFFEQHRQLNGLPKPEKVKTLVLTGADLASGTPENLQRLQSQLVRFNDCYFEEGGQNTFTDGSKVTSNRTLKLADGTSVIVRTSGYSNFWSNTLPEGHGDVVGILSYYGTDWQMMIMNADDCMNFGNPTKNPGSQEVPYTVTQAIDAINAGIAANDVWTTGFIVGAVAPGVKEVKSNADIEFTANVSLDNTLVIAADPEEKDYTKCLIFALPQGTPLRQYGNLLDNPANYGKVITLKGNLGKYLGTSGITGNTGASDSFSIDGVEIPEPVNGTIFSEDFASGMGQFTIENVNLPSGVEAIWKYDSQYKYMIATGYAGGTNYDADSWLISPEIDLKGAPAAFLSFDQVFNFFSSLDVAKTQATVAVRVAGTTEWTTLTVPTYPSAMQWKPFVSSGDIDLSAYVGKKIQIGFHYVSTAAKAGTWEMNNVAIKTTGSTSGGENPGGGDNPGGDTPVTPGDGVSINLLPFKGEAAKTGFALNSPITESGFTFTFDKASGTNAPAYYEYNGEGTIRLYAKNTFNIKGKTISKIVFTINTATGAKRYAEFTPSTGTVAKQASGDASITWTGNASDITFTVGATSIGTEAGKPGQVHISAITIY